MIGLQMTILLLSSTGTPRKSGLALKHRSILGNDLILRIEMSKSVGIGRIRFCANICRIYYASRK